MAGLGHREHLLENTLDPGDHFMRGRIGGLVKVDNTVAVANEEVDNRENESGNDKTELVDSVARNGKRRRPQSQIPIDLIIQGVLLWERNVQGGANSNKGRVSLACAGKRTECTHREDVSAESYQRQ